MDNACFDPIPQKSTAQRKQTFYVMINFSRAVLFYFCFSRNLYRDSPN
ncbi:hypothetical protein ELI_4357 [Eubacterium callanderi]|uniref:Uncharacterized protein n=1 Tax=Eubacterium callanderi TaxID=53442 RepID=E3GQK4_9FIRM|nr:hypothetical protein ELI_4357 [Eubacterium callanderi]